MTDSFYENKFAYFRISNQIVFLEIKAEVLLDIVAAETITSDRLHLQQDVSYPVLFDISALGGTDKSGRDYLAKYGWFLTKRVGILANPFKAMTIARFYLLLSKPNVATQIFNDKKIALQFLESRAE
jgi:hypothetical protein